MTTISRPEDEYPEIVQTTGGVCNCCGAEKEQTPDEYAYDGALEYLIRCAKALRKSENDVRSDLRQWFRVVEIGKAAELDKDVVKLWWTRPVPDRLAR